MSGRLVAILLLLGGSEILGILGGEWFFRLFAKSMPPLAVSQFNLSASHLVFLIYGAVLGIPIFAWALLAAFLGRLFAGGATSTGRAA